MLMTLTEQVQVKCYSGSTYAERPRQVAWQGDWREVIEVRRRWRTPAGPGFQVILDDETTLNLQYDEQSDRWSASVPSGQ